MAANISCLLALVQIVIAKAKNSVKTIIRHIFNIFCPGTKNRMADGPIKSPTMIRTKISRTRWVDLRSLYKGRLGSSVFLACSEEVKTLYLLSGGLRIAEQLG